MDFALSLVVTVAAFGAVMAGLAWLMARARRRGGGAGVMAVVDEVFRPTAHQSHYEIEAQVVRRAPLPSPDDKLTREPPG